MDRPGTIVVISLAFAVTSIGSAVAVNGMSEKPKPTVVVVTKTPSPAPTVTITKTIRPRARPAVKSNPYPNSCFDKYGAGSMYPPDCTYYKEQDPAYN